MHGNIPVPIIPHERVDVVGYGHMVQNRHPISLPGLIQPLQIPLPIPGEFKEEFLLMGSMGDMPYIAGNKVAISPWHFYLLRWLFLGPKMMV